MNNTKEYSNTYPSALVFVTEGVYYFNYGVESFLLEESQLSLDEDNPPEFESEILPGTVYSYIPVKITGTPNYNDIVKAVIRLYISAEEEFDLINSYNRSVIFNEQYDNTKYINYLNLLQNIKLYVRTSLDNYNINNNTNY